MQTVWFGWYVLLDLSVSNELKLLFMLNRSRSTAFLREFSSVLL